MRTETMEGVNNPPGTGATQVFQPSLGLPPEPEQGGRYFDFFPSGSPGFHMEPCIS